MVGLKSTSTVHNHLVGLEKMGFIKRSETTSRSIILVDKKMAVNPKYLPIIVCQQWNLPSDLSIAVSCIYDGMVKKDYIIFTKAIKYIESQIETYENEGFDPITVVHPEQVAPKHYRELPNGYQPAQVYTAWKTTPNVAFALKHIGRHARKNDWRMDLNKAIEYLQAEVDYLEGSPTWTRPLDDTTGM